MKTVLFVVVLLAGLTSLSAENLLKNGDFEKGSSSWSGDSSDEVMDGNTVAAVELHKSEKRILHQRIRLKKNIFELGFRMKYKLSEDFTGKGFRVYFEHPNGAYDWTEYEVKQDKSKWHEVWWNYTDIRNDHKLEFRIEIRQGTGTIYFDDITIISQ